MTTGGNAVEEAELKKRLCVLLPFPPVESLYVGRSDRKRGINANTVEVEVLVDYSQHSLEQRNKRNNGRN